MPPSSAPAYSVSPSRLSAKLHTAGGARALLLLAAPLPRGRSTDTHVPSAARQARMVPSSPAE
jgi:hypothetical protein